MDRDVVPDATRARTDGGNDRPRDDAVERAGDAAGDDGLVDVDADVEFDLDAAFGLTVEDGPPPLDPGSDVLALLGRKYAIPVVYLVGASGGVRFSDLTAALPDASTSTLSARVDELAAAGLLRREEYDEAPPRVEYEPTDVGRKLWERLVPLVAWTGDRD